jgi:putative ABC transport system substrate-binding protein
MNAFNKFAVVMIIFFIVTLCSAEAGAEKKIGVIMFSEETRYSDTLKGMLDELGKEGYGEPKVKFIIESAQASKAKAAMIVRKFAETKMDLIVSLGTSATVIIAKEIKDTPIVFGMVYDPVSAGVVKDWKSSGNNVTGASNQIPMSRVLDGLKAFMPVKRIAVLYTTGEKNSEIQLRNLSALQADYHIKVIPVSLSNKEEVTQILPSVIQNVDALYITGSNAVDSAILMIVDMATRAKVATVTHLDDLVSKGVLIGLCKNSYLHGRRAGIRAVEVLRGAKPSSLPIDTTTQFDYILNMKTAKAGHFALSPQFMKKITKVIE